MIKNKTDLKEYMEKDKIALEKKRKRPRIFGDEIWRFEIYLRKHEYYLNTGKNIIALIYYKMRHHNLGVKLGFTIPCNVFKGGLRINHYGYIVVNDNARIGEFCDIHQGVNIGANEEGKAAKLGDNVWIGPGVKIFGAVELKDNIMIGANAVINKSINESNITIAGVPAKKVSDHGNYYKR